MRAIAENLWIKSYPLRLLGTEQGRVVTIIRLTSGDLIIHSTAPFSPLDVQAISALGRPRWLVDAMLLHDTFAKDAKAAFPELPLLGPEGFAEAAKVPAQPLLPAPSEWAGEVEVLALQGMPKLEEHVFFHRPSRTLIVADFVFNFDYRGNAWERFFRRWAIGLKHQPGMTRVFRMFIQDRAAFKASLATMLEWDFQRVICGHKEVVEHDAKARISQALDDAGLR
jgi:hypothetical protein